MVGFGFAMLGLGAWAALRRFRGRLYDTPLLHRAAIVMGPMEFVAVLSGWITTEVGRQPFTVYGVLQTSDSLAPVAALAVAVSLVAFIVVYFFVFGTGTIYLLRMMNKAPVTPKLGLRDRQCSVSSSRASKRSESPTSFEFVDGAANGAIP